MYLEQYKSLKYELEQASQAKESLILDLRTSKCVHLYQCSKLYMLEN